VELFLLGESRLADVERRVVESWMREIAWMEIMMRRMAVRIEKFRLRG
jgi:hypothetical protein